MGAFEALRRKYRKGAKYRKEIVLFLMLPNSFFADMSSIVAENSSNSNDIDCIISLVPGKLKAADKIDCEKSERRRNRSKAAYLSKYAILIRREIQET